MYRLICVSFALCSKDSDQCCSCRPGHPDPNTVTTGSLSASFSSHRPDTHMVSGPASIVMVCIGTASRAGISYAKHTLMLLTLGTSAGPGGAARTAIGHRCWREASGPPRAWGRGHPTCNGPSLSLWGLGPYAKPWEGWPPVPQWATANVVGPGGESG